MSPGEARKIKAGTITRKGSESVIENTYHFTFSSPAYRIKGLQAAGDFSRLEVGFLRYLLDADDTLKIDEASVDELFTESGFFAGLEAFEADLRNRLVGSADISIRMIFIKSKKDGDARNAGYRLRFEFRAAKNLAGAKA
jgi:hypothetical protein